MTRREKKLCEHFRAAYPGRMWLHNMTDEQIVEQHRKDFDRALGMLQWQAEQCVLASGGLKGDQQMIAIRNAGTEDSI